MGRVGEESTRITPGCAELAGSEEWAEPSPPEPGRRGRLQWGWAELNRKDHNQKLGDPGPGARPWPAVGGSFPVPGEGLVRAVGGASVLGAVLPSSALGSVHRRRDDRVLSVVTAHPPGRAGAVQDRGGPGGWRKERGLCSSPQWAFSPHSVHPSASERRRPGTNAKSRPDPNRPPAGSRRRPPSASGLCPSHLRGGSSRGRGSGPSRCGCGLSFRRAALGPADAGAEGRGGGSPTSGRAGLIPVPSSRSGPEGAS